jgi:hypothetical protein
MNAPSPSPLGREVINEINSQAGERRLSMRQLALRAGIGYRSAQRYLNLDAKDWRELTVGNLERFCDALGLDYVVLVDNATKRLEKRARADRE